MKNQLKTIFLAGVLLFSHSGFSAPLTQVDTPIQIQSDTASIEQLSRQATYEGNVVLTQGNHILHADKLTIKQDKKGQISLMTAVGKPSTFEGKFNVSSHTVYATAKTIYYYPEKQLLVLEGDATMEHQQDKFKGPNLSYQMDKQIISGSKQSDERPTITIHPRA